MVSLFRGLIPSVVQFANIAVSIVSSCALRVRVLAGLPLRHCRMFQKTAVTLALASEWAAFHSAHDERPSDLCKRLDVIIVVVFCVPIFAEVVDEEVRTRPLARYVLESPRDGGSICSRCDGNSSVGSNNVVVDSAPEAEC